jgi:hypothetical protein
MKLSADKLDPIALLCFFGQEREERDLTPLLCETPGKAT